MIFDKLINPDLDENLSSSSSSERESLPAHVDQCTMRYRELARGLRSLQQMQWVLTILLIMTEGTKILDMFTLMVKG